MTIISSILNWIGNTIGDDVMGTTATTLKGAIAELKAVLDPLPDAVAELDAKVDDNATWKKLGTSPATGYNPIQTLPEGAKEALVSVLVREGNNDSVWVNFYVPIMDDFFGAYSSNGRVVNYYGNTNDGYVCVRLFADESGSKSFQLWAAFSGINENLNAKWSVYYR